MHITHMHHVAHFTANFARIRDFYVDTLGLSVAGAFEGRNIVFVGVGLTAIEMVEQTGGRADNGVAAPRP